MKRAVLMVLPFWAMAQGRIEQIEIDLARPQRVATMSIMAATDVTVEATIKRSGAEFDLTDWQGLIWIGNSEGGMSWTNTAAQYGRMIWELPHSSMPTNGKYDCIIFGKTGARVEEWLRCVMQVRGNLALDTMPAEWSTGAAGEIWDMATNALAQALLSQQRMSDHEEKHNNPHGVTAGQIGAATVEQMSESTNNLAFLLRGEYYPYGPRIDFLESGTSRWDNTRLYATTGDTVLELSNSVPIIFMEGSFTNWTVTLPPSFSPRPWPDSNPHPFPFETNNWAGSFFGQGRAIINYNFGEYTWVSPASGSPQELVFDDFLSEGEGAGTATVTAEVYTRTEVARLLTELSAYLRQSDIDIANGEISFNPNVNKSFTISPDGISHYELVTGLVTFNWPQAATAINAIGPHISATNLHLSEGQKQKIDAAITNLQELVEFRTVDLHNEQPTNLVLRLVASNEYILVQEIYK